MGCGRSSIGMAMSLAHHVIGAISLACHLAASVPCHILSLPPNDYKTILDHATGERWAEDETFTYNTFAGAYMVCLWTKAKSYHWNVPCMNRETHGSCYKCSPLWGTVGYLEHGWRMWPTSKHTYCVSIQNLLGGHSIYMYNFVISTMWTSESTYINIAWPEMSM